jgi:glycosyltransferase involved in cell wall biosynthesis
MKRQRQYDVCAAVISDFQFDARVWKEARSLATDGRSVAVVGTVFDIRRTQRRRDPSGVEVCEVPIGRRSSRRSRLRRASALMRVWLEVLSTNARVYHAHDIHVTGAAWLASRLRRAILVYDAHELWSEPWAPGMKAKVAARVSALLERLMMSASDAVITTNQSRSEVLRRKYGRDGIIVLTNVPLLDETVTPRDLGFPPDKRIILYVGRINAEGRAFRETIRALHMLDERVALVVLGFGWESERERIRAWAREEGLEDRVRLLPPLPYDEVAGAAAAAAVGLVPIYGAPLSNALGDTNKLHEYLMGGVPVVASQLPEMEWVVKAGDPAVGEVFDPYSPESIAEAIRTVIDDPRYLERRAQARQLATEHLNWGHEERKLRALYDGLLDQRKLAQSAAILERT